MSAYPPPVDLTPVFNPAQFQAADMTSLDVAYLDAHYLQFPIGQGNITVPSAIIENGITTGASILMEPNTNPPTNYIQFPDGSKQTTANGSSSNVLTSNNNWSGQNQYNTIPTTTTTTSAPSSQIATTQYVANAVSNAIHNITPTVPTLLNWTFDPTLPGPQTKTFTIPDTAYSYVFSVLGCGGLAGLPTQSGNAYGSGGQGGGGGFSSPILQSQTNDLVPPIYEAQVDWKGKIIQGELVSYNGNLAVALTVGAYPTLYAYCGNNGANGNTSGFAAAGAGANAFLPSFNVTTWNIPSTYAWTVSAGNSGSYGDNLTNPPPTSVPVVPLGNPYTPPVNGVGTFSYGQSGALGGNYNDFMYSGELGTGQLYGASTLSGFTYAASPVGLGQISFTINYTDPATIGGQNANFVSFNNTTQATSTQKFVAGTNGLGLQNTSTSRSLGIGAGGFLVNGADTIDPLNLLPIADTSIPTTLAINNEIILQDNEVLSSAQNTIQIQSSPIGVGANFGIDYESTTNQPFTIQTTGNTPIIVRQYGLGATTQQLALEPTEVLLQDTAQSNSASLTIGQLEIDDGGGNNAMLSSTQLNITGSGSTAPAIATTNSSKTGILITDIDSTTSPNPITRQSNLSNSLLQFFNQVAFGYSNQLSVSLNNSGGGGSSGIYHNDNFPAPSTFTVQSTTDLNLESTTGNVNINSNKTINMTASDSTATGKGIAIGKTTPNIYYELNTASPFDRITIDNNGTIESVSVSNSAIASLSPNSIVLQKPATASSLEISSDAGLQFVNNTGIISTYSPPQLQFTTASIMSATGYRGSVYHTDQPTTSQTYYLSFVQSGGVSGYFAPCFDSATLTYNPSTNLLLVNGLQLSVATNVPTSFAAGVLTLEANNASNREFSFPITANMTSLVMSNRRVNGVYTCNITNNSGSPWTISSALTGTNKTSFATATIGAGEFWVMTIKTLSFNTGGGSTTYNCVSLEQFV